MPRSPEIAVTTFARRAASGAFAAALLRGLGLAAGAATAAMLGARLFGVHLAPHVGWTAAVVPVVWYASWRTRRERPGPAAAAAHLDRRLGLDGLLLCAHEGLALDAAQQRRLGERLAALPTALPRIRWRALLPWPAAAVLFAVVVALLPPPPVPAPPLPVAAATTELERLGERLRDLQERGELPEDAERDLAQRLEELQRRLAEGDVPEWRELDDVDRRLERERLLQAAAADAPGDAVPAGDREASADALSAAQVAAAAEALAAAGQLAALPADMQALLDAARREGTRISPESLPQDAAALRALAEAMAQAAAQPGALQQLEAAARDGQGLGGLDGGQLADLRDVLDAFGGAGGATGSEAEAGGAGRGGNDRGPGHAALQMTEDAAGGADRALPLPPGHALPSEWVPLGSRRVDPEAAPVPNRAPGGEAAAGVGGAAWQLELRPRHRAVVQRYFEAGRSAAPGDDRKEKR